MNAKIEQFYAQETHWQKELNTLRRVILRSELIEAFKWSNPCYTFNDKNVLIVSHFKTYCFISFFKGTLLQDKAGLLQKPGANSQAVRLLTFTNESEILQHENLILEYIQEAINLESSGAKVEFKQVKEYTIPVELQEFLDRDKNLNIAFDKLTPGRQKGYLLYFSAAKQAKTRVSRIEKYITRILSGKGINDCTCGKSKRLPSCDGSHKFL